MSLSRKAIDETVKQMRSFESAIDIPFSNQDEILQAITLIRCDYPTAFHVDTIGYSADSQRGIARLTPCYSITKEEYGNLMAQILTKLRDIRKELLPLINEEEKEAFIHDYLCKNVTYKDDGWRSHCIVGPLLDSRGTCDGISKTAQELFHLAGIRSHVITGKARSTPAGPYESHAWNIVRINGKWHHLDITFDNTKGDGDCCYDYYNLSTNAIQSDHTIDEGFQAFSSHCTDDSDWFSENGLSFSTVEEAKSYINDSLKQNAESVYFRMDVHPDDALEDTLSDYFYETVKQYRTSFTTSFSFNPARNTFCFQISENSMMGELLKALFTTRQKASAKKQKQSEARNP